MGSGKLIIGLCDHSGRWSGQWIKWGYTVLRIDPKHDPDMDQGGTGYTAGSGGSGALIKMADGGYGWAATAWDAANLLSILGPVGFSEHLGLGRLEVEGVVAAPPCTDMASSGARWWPEKDRDGRTERSASIVRDCLLVVRRAEPRWWVLENPVGRINKVVPELGQPLMRFDPCDYAGHADDPASEAYTKRTCLYGEFSTDLVPAPVEPVFITKTRKDGRTVRGSWMWANLGGKSERTKELRSVAPLGFVRAFAEAQERVATGTQEGT
jgi:hypothetical protein